MPRQAQSYDIGIFDIRKKGTCILAKAAQVRPGMAERTIVLIGCSVGGVEALQRLVGPLPGDFPAALFVVLHLAPESTSVLPGILTRTDRGGSVLSPLIDQSL
jgi:chemotaxis response regulator CheB